MDLEQSCGAGLTSVLRTVALAVTATAAGMLNGSCAASGGRDRPEVVKNLNPPAVISVWRCRVPLTTTSPLFAASIFRLDLSVAELVERVSEVRPWFERQSSGRYVPSIAAGGEVTLADDQGPEVCVAAASRAAASNSSASDSSASDSSASDGSVVDVKPPIVLVIADAEHRADRPGGWGQPGEAYVGAADFHPDWGDDFPLDLVEHELGHALGWSHSGSGVSGELSSGLDVMSDSASARAIDPRRRHAPGVLAPYRRQVGWIENARLAESSGESGEAVMVAAGMDPDGALELLILRDPGEIGSSSGSDVGEVGSGSSGGVGGVGGGTDADPGPMLFIEAKADAGDDDHLERSGIVIHRLESNGDLTALVGTAPFLRPLGDGDVWSGDGWTVSVTRLAPPAGAMQAIDQWRVSYRRDERSPPD